MSDLPKIIDNNRSVFLDIFKDISSDHNELSIATGYWDLPVMQLVLDHIKDYKKIRILIGREPILKRDNNENIATPEPDYPDEDFFDDLKKINPTEELKNTTLRIKELIESDQLEVRVYRRDFMHAKCYIFGGYDSAKDVTSKSGKAGIRVLEFVKGDGEISKESLNSTVSRIKFGVHIDTETKSESLARSQRNRGIA